jgi:hypothetical protein
MSDFGFDDDGERVPIENPDIYTDEPAVESILPGITPIIFLECMLEGCRNSTDLGERLILFMYLYRKKIPQAPQTTRELAPWLGVSHVSAASKVNKLEQDLRAIREELLNGQTVCED